VSGPVMRLHRSHDQKGAGRANVTDVELDKKRCESARCVPPMTETKPTHRAMQHSARFA
jgi:hypothetical protein